jgi:hypothetical protein
VLQATQQPLTLTLHYTNIGCNNHFTKYMSIICNNKYNLCSNWCQWQ